MQNLEAKINTLHERVYARVYARWVQDEERLTRLEHSVSIISMFFGALSCNFSDIQPIEVDCSSSIGLNLAITCSTKFSIEKISMEKCDKQQELVQFDMINTRLKMLHYALSQNHCNPVLSAPQVRAGLYKGVTTLQLNDLVAKCQAKKLINVTNAVVTEFVEAMRETYLGD